MKQRATSKSKTYTKPELREKLKEKILESSKGGAKGQWSARKAQLLASEYKKAGGGYKTSKTNGLKDKKSPGAKLVAWTKEKWGYISKRDEQKPKSKRGRYLPEKVREELTEGQKKSQNAKKRKAGGVGSRASYSKGVLKLFKRKRKGKKK